MKTKKDYTYLHYIIAILIFLAVRFLVSPINGLTIKGLNVIAIFVVTVYLWLTVSVGWPCLLSIGAVALSGSLTWSEVSSYSFGNFVVPLTISVNILNYALDKTGVAKRIATWFMTRKIVKNKPWMFITMFLFSMFILGLFMESISLMLIYISLAKALFENLGYEKGEKFRMSMMLGILWVGTLTFAATPISHPVPLIALGLLASKGIMVSYVQYMAIGIPFAFVVLLIGILVLKFIVKPDVSKVEKYDVEYFRKNKTPITKQEIWVSAIFIFVILSWIAPSILTFAPKAAATISSWGYYATPFIAICLLCAIKIEREPVINFNEALSHIVWSVVILIATIQMFSSLLGLSSLGINAWLGTTLGPVLKTLPIASILILTLLGGLIMTNFTSNAVSLVIFFAIAAPVIAKTAASPLSLTAYVVLLSLSVNSSFLTPPASAATPIALSSGDLTVGENFKYSMFLLLACAICLALIAYPIVKFIL